MPTSLSNIKVTDGQNNLVITGNDITINGTSILGQNNYVTLDTDQNITGQKTFKKPELIISASYPKFIAKNTAMTRGTYNSSQNECKVIFRDNSDKTLAETRTYVESSDSATSYCIGVVTENENNEAIYKTLYRGTTHKNGTTEISLEQANNIYINNELFIKNTNADITDTTNTYNTGIIHYRDKNGIEYFYTKAYQDTNRIMYEIAGNFGTNSWKSGIQIGYDRSNEKMFARIPTPATSDNSTQIATTGWVNTVGNNVVHLTGNETITGAKWVNNSYIIRGNGEIQFTDTTGYTPSNPPSESKAFGTLRWGVGCTVGNTGWLSGGSELLKIQPIISSQGKVNVAFVVFDSSGNSKELLDLYSTADGSDAAAITITPSNADNSRKIATTAYVNNKLQVVSALPASPDSNTFYFIPA